MTSRREQIMQAAVTAVSGVTGAGLDGHIPVDRDPVAPAPRDANWLIVIEWQRETVDPLTNDECECTLQVQMSVMMRTGLLGDDERAALDTAMSAAHRALMLDRTLGGLCQDILRRAAGRNTQHADAVVNEISHGYEIVYRHSAGDLETL